MECNKLYKEAMEKIDNIIIPNNLFSENKASKDKSYHPLKRTIPVSKGSKIVGVQKENSNILVGRNKNGDYFTIHKSNLSLEDKEAITSLMGAAGLTTYEVQKGDSLSSIANKNNISVGELIKLNRKVDPRKLRPGMKLKTYYNAKDAKIDSDKTFGSPTNYEVPKYVKKAEGFRSKPYKPSSKSGYTIGYGYDMKYQAKYMKDDFKAAGIKNLKNGITERQASVLYSRVMSRKLNDMERILGYNIDDVPSKYKPYLELMAYNGDISRNKNNKEHYKIYQELKNKEWEKAITRAKKFIRIANRFRGLE